MRLFIALQVSEEVKAEMAKIQTELRHALSARGKGNARWTSLAELHLTLKFLGDVDSTKLDNLVAAVRDACRGFPRLKLRAQIVGYFPDLRRPRVVWAGVHDREKKLLKLQHAVATSVRDYTSEPDDKTFAAHVTLGRLWYIGRAQAQALALLVGGAADRFFGEWTADSVDIMRSELSRQGARHTTLTAIPLGDAP
jgi:2'-5' RNA ligase